MAPIRSQGALRVESYKLLAAIVKDKAGAEKMQEALQKELDGLRADMLERGVPAEPRLRGA